MILSMTGYGKGVVESGNYTVEAEIKSLNSRYFELSIRLPRNIAYREFEIREKIKKRINRGKVFFAININSDSSQSNRIQLSKEGLKDTVTVLKEIKKQTKIKDKITLDRILTLKELFLKNEENNTEDNFELIEKALNLAIDEFEKMKKQEGRELEKDLRKRLELIKNAVEQVENRNPESIKAYFEKLRQKAAELTTDLIDNPDRLNMELALLSEKYDVTEECVRLRSHLKLFEDAINNSDDPGRKLNFISQEINREANTINSKSVSSEISHLGIMIKEELEKIREQIQNIE
jgi:uncharacterized protein (TIGR00255 family)